MTEFTLSREDIRTATQWGYSRTRVLIEKPYRLDGRLDPSGRRGGGRTERFRLGDVLVRLRTHPTFHDANAENLMAADAAYRKEAQ